MEAFDVVTYCLLVIIFCVLLYFYILILRHKSPYVREPIISKYTIFDNKSKESNLEKKFGIIFLQKLKSEPIFYILNTETYSVYCSKQDYDKLKIGDKLKFLISEDKDNPFCYETATLASKIKK